MSMLLWVNEATDEALDLGDPFAVWTAFAEMARAAPGEDERWADLYGVPHAAEQDADPAWLARVRAQAADFLRLHGDGLSAGAHRILGVLAE